MNRIALACIMVLILTLAGCTTAQWTTDYDAALQTATTENKYMLLFFSGVQWDAPSKAIKENIFDKESFLKKIGSTCIPVMIDLPQTFEEVPIEQQETLSQRINQYNVQALPTVYLTNAHEKPFALLQYDETVTESAYLKELTTAVKNEKSREKLKNRIESAKDMQKVNLIDELYELTDTQFRDQLMDYAREAVQLDPENKSGNLGKFELMLLYEQVEIFFSTGDRDGAVKLFIDLCESGKLKPAQLQEAYYMAGYLTMIMSPTPDPIILDYFQKSYDADSTSKMADGIKANIDYLTVQFTQYFQAPSETPEGHAAEEAR